MGAEVGVEVRSGAGLGPRLRRRAEDPSLVAPKKPANAAETGERSTRSSRPGAAEAERARSERARGDTPSRPRGPPARAVARVATSCGGAAAGGREGADRRRSCSPTARRGEGARSCPGRGGDRWRRAFGGADTKNAAPHSGHGTLRRRSLSAGDLVAALGKKTLRRRWPARLRGVKIPFLPRKTRRDFWTETCRGRAGAGAGGRWSVTPHGHPCASPSARVAAPRVPRAARRARRANPVSGFFTF